ncbi:MAG: flagellar basal-body MS-ring/collar protein FliF [Rhizomicrobium sp.]
MTEFLRSFGYARFGAMAGVAAALTIFFLYVAGVVSEPAKSILYAGLEPKDAAQVTAKLDAMAVPYEVKGDGGTILVPGNQVTKLRMELASENLPAAGVGYEIFDKSDAFGTTAFVQNINRLRALEGELSRSINTIEGVESSRVHLVIPERQIFSREAQNPSASVVLKTRGTLDKGQVSAIQHLVAAAVADLESSHVAIVDDKGELLAGGEDKTGAEATASSENDQTTAFEDRLRQRIESIVGSAVGTGHVRAQVAAELNYDHVNETSETFDPDSKTIRSSQTVEQNASDANGANGNAVSVANSLPGGQQSQTPQGGNKSDSTRTEETTNYEISKTVRTKTNDGGAVKRISVAVVVDGTTADGTGKDSYKPRTPQELKQIEELVKSAMGYDAARGDQVQVVNMAFAHMDTGAIAPEAKPLLGLDSTDWFKIIEASIFCLTALLMGLFVGRPLIKKMFAPATYVAQPGMVALQAGSPMPALAAGHAASESQATAMGALPAPSGGGGNESMIDISRIEGQVRESSIRKVGEVVQAHPEEALAILRTWLHQPV